ncbi:Mog1p/PsbP-like protein [Macrolepiota fuliginosa MF-IS2]|uniref:Mog1p/PsbP-like protein n=1 Tax=Macrolepiota fuliginosa MF-IS2 TaxID=1400762 RepID=A0A9P6C6T8_9AGAR|nr:Mog1p/PsbP-like protein [Macrolepiota fuliginosa MF-IS2]
MENQYITRDLFGGAITAKMPSYLVDASDLRQIPDNQEVFLYPHNDASLIVEVLESVDETDNSKAIKFHFDSLAHDNSAERSEVQEISVIPNDRGDATPSAIVLHGIQYVKKFNHHESDTVNILMALYRVRHKNVDLAVTLNIPVNLETGGEVTEADAGEVTKDFKELVTSLRIEDFELFA